MNKMTIIQRLFDLYYISKEDCMGFLEQSGASGEQIEDFKRKNATRDKRDRCIGFPVWEKEIEYKGNPDSKANNKSSSDNAVLDSTCQKVIF